MEVRTRDNPERAVGVRAFINVEAYRDDILQYLSRRLNEDSAVLFRPAAERRVIYSCCNGNA